MKPSTKENQWYDVGIVKVTNMVVSHYYVPYDGNVIDVRATEHDCPFKVEDFRETEKKKKKYQVTKQISQ